MDAIFLLVSPLGLAAAVMATLLASFVKGAVGFAMPVIMISVLSSFLPAQIALAALIVPTLLANVWQAGRGGPRLAWQVVRTHWRYVTLVLIFIGLSAQLVTTLPQAVLYLVIGFPATLFAVMQLSGWAPRLPEGAGRRMAELALGSLAGLMGGMSGVWGPPTVAYLTAIGAPKVEAIRVQGVVYGLGSVALMLAHVRSGILSAQTAPLSVLLVLPMIAGMWLGMRVQDRLDQARFKKLVLLVLAVVGLNLVRRGLTDLL